MATGARKRSNWSGGNPSKTIDKLEGLLQKLRDQPPEHRPDQTTPVYLATQFGVSVPTMKRRIVDAEAKRSRSDLADHFVELVEQIGNVLGESICALTFKVARDLSNRNAFNAQKWILERTDPETYGDKTSTAPTTTESGSLIRDVPQEVWDEADETDQTEIEEIETIISNALLRFDHVVRRVQKRVADKRVQEDNNDGDE